MTPKIIFYFGVGVGVGVGVDVDDGGRLFLSFKSLDNNMVHSSSVNVYLYGRNRCRTKVLWV